jgi:toxin ParE1/3/4
MRTLLLTPDANEDLIEIWQKISDHSVDAADRMIERICQDLDMLCRFPGFGHVREDVKVQSYRFWTVHPFVIVYRYSSAELMVMRVIHGHREFRALFDLGR